MRIRETAMAKPARGYHMTVRVLIAVFLSWGIGAGAGQAAETQTGDLTIWTDYACYRIADDPAVSEVEFYFAFKRHEFTFLGEPGGFLLAQVGLWVQMLNLQDQPLTDTISAYFGCTVADSADVNRPDFKVFYALPVQLPPGSYRARIIALDMYGEAESRKFGELVLPVLVRDFSPADLMISDLKLAYDIDVIEELTEEARLDVLTRNMRKVYPDPRGVLSRNRPQLYFYGEIYNLQHEPGGENVYELGFRFLTPENITIKDFGTRAYKKPGVSSVLATALPTGDLPEGDFILEITVTDGVNGSHATATRPFTVLLEARGVDSLTAEQAQDMRNVILYLARKEELRSYDALSLKGKTNYLRKFWKRFDPTPNTPYNEFKEEHFRRFNYVNEQYSTTFSSTDNGWRTDRGRIFIKYGPPDEIEHYPSSLSDKPWEEWFYYQFGEEGEVFFIFEDEDGFGDYRLVHSTARGEIRDPMWERKIQERRLIR
jgi:GWxTD domain-containing protein